MKFKQEGATYLPVVWLGVIVAQAVGSPMDPLEQHVLAVQKGSLDSHLEGPACDSASLH
jgi:nitrogen fixation/metabolism regulation signal transduction histidine kinase